MPEDTQKQWQIGPPQMQKQSYNEMKFTVSATVWRTMANLRNFEIKTDMVYSWYSGYKYYTNASTTSDVGEADHIGDSEIMTFMLDAASRMATSATSVVVAAWLFI